MASGEKKRITPHLGPALSFHGFAEELVDSGLIPASLALQPGQHIGVHANRHRLLDGAIKFSHQDAILKDGATFTPKPRMMTPTPQGIREILRQEPQDDTSLCLRMTATAAFRRVQVKVSF